MVDQGALIEVDDPDFVIMPGYRAVYDVHGDGKYIFDTCVSVEALTKSGQMEGKNALYYLLACILK